MRRCGMKMNEIRWMRKTYYLIAPDRHSTCGYTDMRENAETSCHWLWISRHRWQQQQTNERVFRKRMLCVLCIDIGMRKSMYSNRPWSANWMWCKVGWFVGDALSLSVSLRRSKIRSRPIFHNSLVQMELKVVDWNDDGDFLYKSTIWQSVSVQVEQTKWCSCGYGLWILAYTIIVCTHSSYTDTRTVFHLLVLVREMKCNWTNECLSRIQIYWLVDHFCVYKTTESNRFTYLFIFSPFHPSSFDRKTENPLLPSSSTTRERERERDGRIEENRKWKICIIDSVLLQTL